MEAPALNTPARRSGIWSKGLEGIGVSMLATGAEGLNKIKRRLLGSIGRNRITRFFYTFPTLFKLTGMDEICPAGEYEVTTEEEPIGDFMVPAYRRVSTTIFIPPPMGRPGIGQIIEINPEELSSHVLKS